MQQKIRELLCIVTRDDPTATAELNKYVYDRVMQHITPGRITPTLVSSTLTHTSCAAPSTRVVSLVYTCRPLQFVPRFIFSLLRSVWRIPVGKRG